MAPIKFEEQLKEKLEQRSIQPSSDAWSKLSDRLDEESDSKNVKGYWWIGIAATIVGVLLALTFVFNSNTDINEPIIVDINNETVIKKQNLQQVEANQVVVKEVEENKPIESQKKETKQQTQKAPLKSVIKERQEVLIPNKIEEAVAVVKSDSKIEDTNKTLVEAKPEVVTFETQKINEVVAKIQQLQKESQGVTNEDIEKLLEAAQKEITIQKLYSEATKTVDADALLQSVEEDLEQSFRSKVFEAIKSGYDTVKTAVAERNN